MADRSLGDHRFARKPAIAGEDRARVAGLCVKEHPTIKSLLTAVPPLLMALFMLGVSPAHQRSALDICANDDAPADQAIASCREIIQSGTLIGDNLAAAYNNLGIGYNGKGQYDLAIAHFTSALSIDPDLADAYNNRGRAYHNKGQFDLAIADYTSALELEPDYVLAYNNRGIAYRDKGQYELAIADFTEALRIDGNDAAAYYDRGLVYNAKQQYDRAIADFSRALRLDPGAPQVYYARALAYDRKGRYNHAIADDTEALSIDPHYSSAYDNRGFTYRNKGEYDLALADFSEALQIDPNDAFAYTGHGSLLLALGRISTAARDLARAASLDRANVYSVLWLHVAQMRTNATATSKIAVNAASFDPRKWPAPVVEFYLGKKTAVQTLAAAVTSGQRCEARFFIAEGLLAHDELNAARSGFREAAATCPPAYVERAGARAELLVLTPPPSPRR